jgi:hypothetical protein
MGLAWLTWNGWEKHFLKLKRFFIYRRQSDVVQSALATVN